MQTFDDYKPSAPPSPAPAVAEASLQFLCPRCEEMFLYPITSEIRHDGRLRCPHCRLEFTRGAGAPRPDAPLEKCWACSGEEFYIQKDFNRELGFMIVAGSAMLVLLVMLTIGHIPGIVCLFGIAAADWVIYRLLANVTVCYLCQSIYRGFPFNSRHAGFYLGHEEKFKKLRQKWLRETLGER